MNTTEVRAHTDRLLRRMAGLDQPGEQYSRARAEAIELNIGLVRHLAHRYAKRPDVYDDVYQTGLIGLIHAVDRYDPDYGAEFIAFARPTIEGQIKRHLRDTSWPVHVPRRQQELFLTVVKAGDQLRSRLGREASRAEIATATGVTVAEVDYGRDAADAYSTDSLDAPVAAADGKEPVFRLDGLGAEDPELDLVDFRVAVAPLINKLPEREQTILRMRFWDDMTQREIGLRLGLSQMHVSRLLAAIFAGLRHRLDTGPSAAACRGEVRVDVRGHGHVCAPATAAATSTGSPPAPRCAT